MCKSELESEYVPLNLHSGTTNSHKLAVQLAAVFTYRSLKFSTIHSIYPVIKINT